MDGVGEFVPEYAPVVSPSSSDIIRHDGVMEGQDQVMVIDLTLDTDDDEETSAVVDVPGEIKVTYCPSTPSSSESLISTPVQQPPENESKAAAAAANNYDSSDSSSSESDDSTVHPIPVQQPTENEYKAAAAENNYDSSDSSSSESDDSTVHPQSRDEPYEMERNENASKDQTEVDEHQLSWIQEGTKLQVHHNEVRKLGGGDLRDATAIGPVHQNEEDIWVVEVKWDWDVYGTDIVECSRIVQPGERRKRKATSRFSPHGATNDNGIQEEEDSQEATPKRRRNRKRNANRSLFASKDDTALQLIETESHSSPSSERGTLHAYRESEKAHAKAPGGVLSVDDNDDIPVPKRLQQRKEEHLLRLQEIKEDNTLDPALAEDILLHLPWQRNDPTLPLKEAPRFDKRFNKRQQRIFQSRMNHFFVAHPELNKEDEGDLKLASDYLVQGGFSVQQATKLYEEDKKRQKRIKRTSPFYTGLKVIKRFNGQDYEGTIQDGAGHFIRDQTSPRWIRVWKVRYPDKDEEDLSYEEVLKFRKDNPRPSPRNRPFRCLELFAGKCTDCNNVHTQVSPERLMSFLSMFQVNAL